MPLLIAFLLAQSISISGTLKDADGKPITGVRIAAMPVAESVLLGSTKTDRDGRYTLELPPGAYSIVAGNVVWPTYYTANGARVVISTSRDGVDFVVNPTSLQPLLRREELPIQWDVPPTPPKFPWPR